MLDEEYRKRLDKILGSMAEKGYGKPEMQTVVDDFKSIYDPDARIDESEFRAWYQDEAIRNNLSPDPDDPRHFYNYRAAFRSGAEPDETGHWPSKFKREGHPNLIIDGVDTRTNEPPDWDMFKNPTPYFEQYQQTGLAPKRSAQVTGAPTQTAEVPVENVRTEQMQLTSPAKQPEIMPPAEIRPAAEFGAGAIIGASKMDLKNMIASNIKGAARSVGGDLAEPNPVLFNRGKQLVESNSKPEAPEDKQAVQYYTLHKRGMEWSAAAEPVKKAMMDYADEIEKTIPEKDKQTVQDAQDWLTTKEAALPQNYPRTAAAIAVVSAANGSSNLMALAGAIPVIGTPAAAAGAASLVNRERESWIDNARAAGLDDEKLLETFGNFYAVPSGVVEYGSSAVMTGPLRALAKSKKFAPFLAKATVNTAKKSILKSVIGQVLGTAGAVATEGAEEFTQQEMQDGVLWWALTEAAKQHPEKADQYIEQRDKINLPQTTTDAWKSFIVGAAAALPVTLVSRLAGGVGKRMQNREAPETTAPMTEQPAPEQPVTPSTVSEKTTNITTPPEFKAAISEKGEIIPTPEIQSPEAETIKMPVVPAEGAKVVKKTAEATQTYVPKEQGSIIPTAQPQETPNVQQEEKGRVQVAPPPQETTKSEMIRKYTEPQKFGAVTVTPDQMDGLTELPNNTVTKGQKENVSEDTWTISVDADHFKAVNDVFGHDEGDRVLKQIGVLFKKHFPENFIGREGGEEFFGEIGNTITPEIENRVKAFHSDIAENIKLPDGSAFTVSIGLGKGFGLTEKGNKRLNSDVAAYRAKELGRNQIAIDNGQEKGYTLIEGPAVGEKKYLTQFSKGQINSYVDLLEKNGNLDPAAAQRIRNEIGQGEEGTPRSGRELPEKPPATPTEKTVTAPQAAPTEEESAEPSPKALLNSLAKQLVAAQKAEKKAQKRAKKKVPKSLSKRIIIKNTKELPPEAKQMLGEKGEWEAAVWYNPRDEVIEVHINENLSPEKYAEALYHEIPGHLGQRLVFADSPALLNTMRQMYGAAKARGDIALKGIEKAYKTDIEKAGSRGDDLLFEEWTAHNLHRYLNENDKASLPTRIYNLFRSALVKIGVVKQNVDDVLRNMVKKMRKAKDAGIIEKAISENFKRPIYDIESAKAIAQEYGLEFSGSEPSKGGPNYLFTHRKSGTQFRAKTREEVGQAVGAIADRVAPKGTVKAGEGIRFKKPVVEEKPELPQPEPREKMTEPGIVDLTVNDETKAEAFRRVVTDRYHRLRRLMETAEEKTGTPLPDELNAYVKQDIIQSKVKARIDKILKGTVDKIADIAQAAKLTVREIDEYLYAKHAPEANRVVAERRPDMVEKGLPASGMTDEEAQKIIAAAEKNGNKEALEQISGIVQKWNRARLDAMVEDGLLSQEQRDSWENEYEFYVPLKGGLDEEGNVIEGERPRTGKGYSVKGAESRMRSGRYTKAQNILAHLASDTAEKIVRGEKNRVIRSLYDFSEKFKNDLILTEPVVIKKTFNKEKGIFEDRKLSNFEIGLTNKYGTPISFKIDGKPLQMLIKDEPLMRAMTNMGSEHGEIMTRIFQGIATINRYLAITRTQLSLNFIPSNALRDTMTAQLNAIGLNLPKEKQQGLALDILKTVPKALKWAYEGEMGKSTKGADAFNDFVENGGAIEFLGMRDIEDSQKKLEQAINGLRPGVIGAGERVMRGAYDYVTKVNSAVENANRLATYTQLVKRGVSKQQAAYIAKNITVNFNRKGELGSFLNAWALFANAGFQGSVRILKTLRDSPTVRAIAGGIIATSLAHAELMRLFAGDDPEDDKNYYDKISDFTRDTHMVIPWGKLTSKETKAYQRIPLPYGYNVFWAAGQHISRVIHGGVKKIPEESLHLIGAVADAFNPIGGSVDLADPKAIVRNFTPTILQPIAEIAVNQNFMGAPAYQESKAGYGPQPTYSHAGLKSTPQAIKNFTAWASDITGGGKYREGAFDKLGIFSSPDVINHLVEFATGGTGKVVTDLASLPFEWVSNKKIPAKGLPIVQRFYGEINEYKDVKTLYDNLDKGQRIYNQFKEYTQTDKEKAKKLLFQYPAMISMMKKKEGEYINKNLKTVKGERIPLNLRVIKPLKAMNEQKKKYDEAGNKEGVKRMEKMIVNHAQTWNKRLEKMLEPLPIKEKKNE
jgi:diguanylate cyclase (GGDEF)-like protein